MRSFVPVLRPATLLGPQDRPEDKLGGLPWGFPADRWPICGTCESPLVLLAQWFHHPDRLDLGREGRCLFVFQCSSGAGLCATWSGDGEANSCHVLEPEDLGRGPTSPPEPGCEPETEARILRWEEAEDGVPEEMESAFFDDTSELPESMTRRVHGGTRLGGVPHWLGGAEEGPGADWRFVGQIDSTLRFTGSPPSPDAIGCSVGRPGPTGYRFARPRSPRAEAPNVILVEVEDGERSVWTAEGPTFGDGGTGYVFLSKPTSAGDPSDLPRGWFFWQTG